MSKTHAGHYADSMLQVDAAIVHNEIIGEETFRVRVAAPDLGSKVAPGQFVMIRIKGTHAPLIGRALAVYDVVTDEPSGLGCIDLVYLRKGTLTTALASCPPETEVTLWGPLGNGFATDPCDRLIMAVGGIGQTPMLLLGQEAMGSRSFAAGSGSSEPRSGEPRSCEPRSSEPRSSEFRPSGWAKRVELIYGARRASLLAGVDDFRNAGFDVTLCTDDGSAGEAKRVPDVLAERLAGLDGDPSVRVVTCGPEIMMQKVAEICQQHSVDCQVSMETPMACGIGICFSCVAQIRQDDGSWDYKRTCVEGPIFDARQICWD